MIGNLFGIKGVQQYKIQRLLKFSVPQMYAIIADVDSYKEFVPNCTASRVLAAPVLRPNQVLAELVVEYKIKAIGLGITKEKYTSIVTLNHPNSVLAVAEKGNLFHLLNTEWKFSESSVPGHCIVDFKIEFEFQNPAYNLASKVYFNEVLVETMTAFENRCKFKYMPRRF